MKKLMAIFLCITLTLLPLLANAEAGAAAGTTGAAGFETNVGWSVFPYDGNSFEIRDDGLYTKHPTNTVFARSDKYVDGSVSFTMEYEVDILSVVKNDYVWNEGWLYYTFSLGMPSEEDEPYNEAIKVGLLSHSGLTMMPLTDGGVYLDLTIKEPLPEEIAGEVKHLTVKIEYTASDQILTFTVNGIEVYTDYFDEEFHEGYLGIETAWTEMLVTKAIYTEYPDGLPSEKTAEPQPTKDPAEQTDVPATADNTQPAATDEPGKNGSKASDDDKSTVPVVGIILGVIAAAAVIAAIAVIVIRKKKK